LALIKYRDWMKLPIIRTEEVEIEIWCHPFVDIIFLATSGTYKMLCVILLCHDYHWPVLIYIFSTLLSSKHKVVHESLFPKWDGLSFRR
jgi:hypothetical protein